MLFGGVLWALAVGVLLAWSSRRQPLSPSRDPVSSRARVRAQADALRACEVRLESRVLQRTAELTAPGDARLPRVLLENPPGNAWKFTSKRFGALIGFFSETADGVTHYAVRDNGVGFDMAYAGAQGRRVPGDGHRPGRGAAHRPRARRGHRSPVHSRWGATFRFTLQEVHPASQAAEVPS